LGKYLDTATSMATSLIGTTFDTVTTSLIVELISDAEAEINKYISKRYDLSSNTFQTSTSCPPLLTTLTRQLTKGYFYRDNSRGGKESLTRAKEYINDVRDNLKMIADYKVDLLDTSGSIITDKSETSWRIQSSTVGYTDTFAEDDSKEWAVDTDKLDAIDDSRD